MTTGDLAKSYASIGRIIDRFETRAWRLHVRDRCASEAQREKLLEQLLAYRALLRDQLKRRTRPKPAARDPIDDVLESMLRNVEAGQHAESP